MRIVVMHGGYGCETGCCGHYVETDSREYFEWEHPRDGQDHLEFAKAMVAQAFGEEHVADLDWENSFVVDDCEFC